VPQAQKKDTTVGTAVDLLAAQMPLIMKQPYCVMVGIVGAAAETGGLTLHKTRMICQAVPPLPMRLPVVARCQA